MKVKTTGSILIVALAAVVVCVLIFFRSVPIEAVYPVERARNGIFRGLRTRVRALFLAQSVAGENVRLKREVASLALAQADVERLETEIARLRRALDYSTRTPETWIAAEVLSEGGAAVGRGRTIRLDKGSLAGVTDGAVVVVPEGLVGRVTSVSPHTAEVTLITDASVQVACEIETAASPKPRGILSGTFERGGATSDCAEGSLVLKHLKNAAEVPPRSRVLTSGLGGIFPGGLEIGTLQTVRSRDASGLKIEGEVLPSVDFESLEDVFIRREK